MGRLFYEGVSPETLVDAVKSWFTLQGLSVETVSREKGTWILQGHGRFHASSARDGNAEAAHRSVTAVLEARSRGVSVVINDSEHIISESLRRLQRQLDTLAEVAVLTAESCPKCATTVFGGPKYCPQCGFRLEPYVW